MLALVAAAALFVLTMLAVTNKPIVYLIAVLAWGCAVFTADTALGGAGTQAGVLTVPKLAPLAVLGATSVWFLITPKRTANSLTAPLGWVAGYLGWLAVCAIFSFDAFSGLTRVVQFAIPLIALLAARRVRDDTTSFLLVTCAAAAAHVLYALIFDPDYVGNVGEERLTGLLIANAFGLAAGVTFIAAFGLWLSHRSNRAAALALWALMAVSGYSLVQAAARTAVIAVIAALVVTLVAARTGADPKTRRRIGVAAAVLLAVGIYLFAKPELIGSATATFVRGNDDITELTGRIPLWHSLITAVADHPFFGFGPSAFRSAAPNLGAYLSAPQLGLGGAHNGLMQALVDGGIIAGLLWIAVMIAVGRHVWRTRPGIRPVAIALFVFSAVSTITGTNANGIGMGWFLLLALAALPEREHAETPAAVATEQVPVRRHGSP